MSDTFKLTMLDAPITPQVLMYFDEDDNRSVFSMNGKRVFSLGADGSVRKLEAYTAQDDVSCMFWDMVSANFPKWKERVFIN